MSEWLDYVKAYAAKNNVTYKQALKDASPSYKTRNEKKPDEIKQEQPTKLINANLIKKWLKILF